jgi:predicted Ser/Thr protein kinase
VITLGPGQRLGPYEILSPVGAGVMGEVWQARDTRLNRTVSIKVSKEQFSERFEQEARAVAALNHPNICTLHDVGPNYLVMEFVEGAPLKGPMPIGTAVEYAGQILEALDAAHRKGITHRDLKPANILLTKQGIKLLDFGLAKQTGPIQETDTTKALTSPGQILGTLQYMSPEQLQGKPTDARSDLFSFGCVLYEMLNGKRAFEGESAASVIAAIIEREPAPLTVAPPLERIVRRSLAKDPDQRFQTARDLKAALTWAVEQPPPSAAAKPRRLWWIAVAVLAIIALGGWAVVHVRNPPADERVLRLQIDPPEGGRFVFGSSIGGVALSPDGRMAAFVASGNGKGWLWVRPLNGTNARLIPGTEGAGYPFWSPDGKSIAFFTTSKLQRIDLAGGAPLVICDVVNGRGGAWTSDGHILYGTVAFGLFQVPASGGTPAPLTTLDAARGEAYHRWPQVLPDGRFLYLVQSAKAEDSGIYVASFAKPREPARVLASDSATLYAASGAGKGYLLWLRGGTLLAQEFDPATLKLSGEPLPVADPVAKLGSVGAVNVAVSAGGLLHDGRFVLYFSLAPNTDRDLWVLDVTPDGKPSLGATPRPYRRTPFSESWGRFSPEAPPRWVAYHSNDTGRNEVYIQAFPEPRGKFQISTGGGQYPQWGAGGRELFYVAPDNKLMAVSLKLGTDSVEPSAPRELFVLPAVDTGWNPYDTDPDGQRFLVRATPERAAAQPLTVIVNWPALLKKGAPAP